MKSLARLALIASAAAVATLAGAAPALAAMNTYMRADGVNGPIVRDGQPGWFKLDNFHWGSATKPAPGNKPPRVGSGAFSFTKIHDMASTGLMQKCATGTHIPKAEIHRVQSSKTYEKYLVFNLSMTSCPDEGSLGLEQYAFEYGSIQWKYVTPKGEKPKGWVPGK